MPRDVFLFVAELLRVDQPVRPADVEIVDLAVEDDLARGLINLGVLDLLWNYVGEALRSARSPHARLFDTDDYANWIAPRLESVRAQVSIALSLLLTHKTCGANCIVPRLRLS